MKLLVYLMPIFMGLSIYGQTKFCGKLTSLTFQTDIYQVIRMGIYNGESSPKYMTVKDENTIIKMIRLVSNNSNYVHEGDMDDYNWSKGEDDNSYFLCVTSDSLREYRGKYFMDRVDMIQVWQNGVRVSFAESSLTKRFVCKASHLRGEKVQMELIASINEGNTKLSNYFWYFKGDRYNDDEADYITGRSLSYDNDYSPRKYKDFKRFSLGSAQRVTAGDHYMVSILLPKKTFSLNQFSAHYLDQGASGGSHAQMSCVALP